MFLDKLRGGFVVYTPKLHRMTDAAFGVQEVKTVVGHRNSPQHAKRGRTVNYIKLSCC